MAQSSQFRLTGSISQLPLNAKMFEALSQRDIHLVEQFLDYDLSNFGSFPGVGKKKLSRLIELQEELRCQLNRPANSMPHARNAPEESIYSHRWSARELTSLKTLGVETVRDFLQADLKQLKGQKKVGRVTCTSMLKKQKQFIDSYGPLLTKQWDEKEVPLNRFHDFTLQETDFLTALSMESIQEFLLIDLRLLPRGEAEIALVMSLQEKQRVILQRQLDCAEIPMIELPCYRQWKGALTEESVKRLPFFSNQYNKGFSASDFHASFSPGYSLDNLVFPKKLLTPLKKAGITKLGELLLIPAFYLDRLIPGVTEMIEEAKTILEEFLIDHKHQRYEADFSTPQQFALSLINYISGHTPRRERWGKLRITDDRRLQILMQRSQGKTLDEVGTGFGITRERIRQIEHNMWRQIASFRNRLEQVEQFIAEITAELGRFVKDKQFYQKVADINGWTFTNAKYFMEHFLEIFASRFEINEQAYITFADYRCPRCPVLWDAAQKCAKSLDDNGEIISIAKFSAKIRREMTGAVGCRRCPEKHRSFPAPIFAWLFESQKPFKVFRKKKTVRLTGKMGLYESILLALKSANRPMTKREILHEVQRLCPKLKITEKQIKTTAGNSLQHTREILLWNRGGMNSESMYVYKDYINTNLPILQTIENDLLARAKKTKVPQMRLNRIFGIYTKECQDAGIPNVYALFAALKCRSHPDLLFQRSPYIGFSGQKQKGSNAKILEDFVRDKGGMVTVTALKNFGRSLGLRDEHIQNTISLTRLLATRRGFILYESFDPKSLQFAEIVEAIRADLAGVEHLTIMEIHQRHQETFNEMGVIDPRMLYHLLRRFAGGKFTMEFPIVSLRKKRGRRNLRLRLAKRVQRFLTEKGKLVSARKIFDFFGTKLGYPQAAINKVLAGEAILHYGNGVYTFDPVIGWTKEDQQRLALDLDRYWTQQKAKGTPYGDVEGLLEMCKEHLPPIGKKLQWNRHLLASFLIRNESVSFLGNNRNTFGLSEPDAVIGSFGDFVKYLLLKNYNGSATLKEFARYLAVNIKSIKRELTSHMLVGYDDIQIEEGRIFVVNRESQQQ